MNINSLNLNLYFFRLSISSMLKNLLRLGLESSKFSNNGINLSVTPDKKYISNYSVLSSLVGQYSSTLKEWSSFSRLRFCPQITGVCKLFSYRTSRWAPYFLEKELGVGSTGNGGVDALKYSYISKGCSYLCLAHYKSNLNLCFDENHFTGKNRLADRVSVFGRKFKKSITSFKKLYFIKDLVLLPPKSSKNSVFTYASLKKSGLLSTLQQTVGLAGTGFNNLIGLEMRFISTRAQNFFKANLKINLGVKNFTKIIKLLNYVVLKKVRGGRLIFKNPSYKNIGKSNQVLCDLLTCYSISRNFNKMKGLRINNSFFYEESSKYLGLYVGLKLLLVHSGFFEVVSNGIFIEKKRRTVKYSLTRSLLEHFKHGFYNPVFELGNVFLSSRYYLNINEFSCLALIYPYFQKTRVTYIRKYSCYGKDVTGVYLHFLKKTASNVISTLSLNRLSLRWNYLGGQKWDKYSAYYSYVRDFKFHLKFGRFSKGVTGFLNKNYSLFGVEFFFKNHFSGKVTNPLKQEVLFKKKYALKNTLHECLISFTVHKRTLASFVKWRALLLLKKAGFLLDSLSLKLLDVFNVGYGKKVLLSLNSPYTTTDTKRILDLLKDDFSITVE